MSHNGVTQQELQRSRRSRDQRATQQLVDDELLARRELLQERAAIVQYDAGVPSNLAEHVALAQLEESERRRTRRRDPELFDRERP
jgi:hypothetical protein